MGRKITGVSSGRIAYLDQLKGFVILCVVLGHVLDGYISGSYWPECEGVLTIIFNVIYSFHMPLCFILSGYFFRLAYVKEGRINRKKLYTHAIDFVIVYVFFSLVFWMGKMLMSSYVNSELSFSSIFYIWRTPLPSFWYLYVLIAYYFIFSVMWWKKYSPGVMFIALIVISLVSTLLPSGIWFQVQRILYYAPFFYLGIYMREKPDAFFMEKKFCSIVGALSVVVSIALAILGDQVITIPLLDLAVAFGISILLWKVFEKLNHPNRGGVLAALWRKYVGDICHAYSPHGSGTHCPAEDGYGYTTCMRNLEHCY